MEESLPCDQRSCRRVHPLDGIKSKLSSQNIISLPMRLFGIKRKKIPGHEFAGEIEETGIDVKRFKVGDLVFGTTTGYEFNC